MAVHKKIGTYTRKEKIIEQTDILVKERAFRSFEELILRPEVEGQIELFLKEQAKKDELWRYKLKPRRKILMTGPPGTGKTSVAECLANELDLEIWYANFNGLLSSSLDRFGDNLRRLEEEIAKKPVVVFFDEFEAIARSRKEAEGESKRLVPMVLNLIDRVPDEVVCLAATNHPELLDKAAARRFDFSIHFELPDLPETLAYLKLFEKTYEIKIPINLDSLAHKLMYNDFSRMEIVLKTMMRLSVLNDEEEISKKTLLEVLEIYDLHRGDF